MSCFKIDNGRCMLDGKPFRVFSAAMHYFRVLPELWEDRLAKIKAMGINTLETYTAWNMHEPRPGMYDFEGRFDLERYLELADRMGFKVIIRPGPYICSEWDFGALPAWLLNIPGVRLRCFNKPYLDAVTKFFDVLLPKIEKYSCVNGGPVIVVQVENEYGSYGNDKQYLRFLSELLAKHLPGLLQMTSDGPDLQLLRGGTLPNVWPVANFGSNAPAHFDTLEQFRPGIPKMCGEFWNGWFDHWCGPHHSRKPAEAAEELKKLLDTGGSVSLYMGHGGTNYAFTNGANMGGPRDYAPTVSSYDDDAPVNEAGRLTEKYDLFRELFRDAGADVSSPLPPETPVRAFGTVALTESALLLDSAHSAVKCTFSATPLTMESLGQNFGFILYSKTLDWDLTNAKITIDTPVDRAQLFVNGYCVGTVYCNDAKYDLTVTAKAGDRLDILVENMGRCNYGPYMERNARKGISDCVRLGNQILFGWEIRCLPMEDLSFLNWTGGTPRTGEPSVRRGTFTLEETADTFLRIPGVKGIAWVNGFNLGRYWEAGPTRTMYVPAALLRKGENTVEVLELHHLHRAEVCFEDKAEL